jgi:hypothetical protein
LCATLETGRGPACAERIAASGPVWLRCDSRVREELITRRLFAEVLRRGMGEGSGGRRWAAGEW